MKDEDKKKAELIKNLKTLRKKREKSAANNITGRKLAEEKSVDSEEYLKILFDYAPDAYYINDLKGNFVDGNLAAERLTGYKREELIGKSFLKLKLLSPADIPKAAKLLAKNLMGHPTGPDEFVMNRKDNKVTVEVSTYPVKIKGRNLILGIARDITERKQTEQAIKESESRFKELFNNTNSGIAVYEAKDNGRDFIFKDFNQAAEKIDKLKRDDIIGKSILQVFPGVKDFGLFQAFQEVYQTGKPINFPSLIIKTRGSLAGEKITSTNFPQVKLWQFLMILPNANRQKRHFRKAMKNFLMR